MGRVRKQYSELELVDSEGREVAQADHAGNVTTVIKLGSLGTSLESVSLQWAQQGVASG